jgi:hypothetical protein
MIKDGEWSVMFRRFLFQKSFESFFGYTFGVLGIAVFSSAVTRLLFSVQFDFMKFTRDAGFD